MYNCTTFHTLSRGLLVRDLAIQLLASIHSPSRTKKRRRKHQSYNANNQPRNYYYLVVNIKWKSRRRLFNKAFLSTFFLFFNNTCAILRTLVSQVKVTVVKYVWNDVLYLWFSQSVWKSNHQKCSISNIWNFAPKKVSILQLLIVMFKSLLLLRSLTML